MQLAAAVWTVAWLAGFPDLSLGASALGFLVWNWPPARIFMGDVGSGTLGFAFGTLVLAAERSAGVAVAHPGATVGIVVGAAVALVVIGWALMRIARRRVRVEPEREPELAPAAEVSAPGVDDDGDLTVMMRRQG